MERSAGLATRLSHLAIIVVAALLANRAAIADTVWIQSGKGNPIALNNVKISGVETDALVFTTSSGRQTSKPLAQVPRIHLDDEPAFNAGEDGFAASDYAAAGAGYRKAIQTTDKPWLKQRATLRLVEAANQSGNFPDAVAGFIELLQLAPATATEHKPVIPRDRPDLLNDAAAQLKQASQSAALKPEPRAVLLNYLAEVYAAKGDAASANAVLKDLNQSGAAADTTSADGRRVEADLKMTQARQAFAQQRFAQVVQVLDSGGADFVDPQQQADALFLLAEAKEGAANAAVGDAAGQLKDAALAYVRVVAVCKGIEGQPHVAEALLKAAAIEEKLKNTKEAVAIYNQVAGEFKGTRAAARAQQEINRLQASEAPKG